MNASSLRKVCFSCAVSALALASFSGAAQACSCAPTPPAQAVERAELIFTGTAVAAATRRYETVASGEAFGGARDRLVTRFDVQTLWKGTTADPVEVVTEQESAACGIVFEVGRTYTVFATSQAGTYTTNLCAMLPAISESERPRLNEALRAALPNPKKL